MIYGDPEYGGLARVIRWVPHIQNGDQQIVSALDASKNLLFVARPLFDQLDPGQQRQVLRTDAPFTYAATAGN